MAKIPMGNFGNAMPQVDRIQMPQNQTGQMIAGALQNVSQVTGQYAQQKDQQQREAEVSAKRLELYNNQIAEQEAKVKLDDVLTTEMSEQVTLLKNDVSNGKTKAQDANVNLQKWSQDRYKQLEAEMPGHAQVNLKQYWDSNVTKQAPGFLPLQLRADVQKDAVLVERYSDIATRYDRKEGREYLTSNLANSSLSEADKQERLYKYESTRDGMDIDDRITVAVSGKNTAELQTLITDLDSGKYGYIDGPTAQQKKTQALSRIEALNTQIKAEENKRESEAGKYLNDFKSQVLTGRALDDDYLANVGTAVKGTEHEAEYEFYKQQSGNFQSFSRKSTSEQLALINEQKAKMKNSKTNDAVTEEKVLGVYESLYKEKLSVLKDNPNQVVRETGLKVNELSAVELKTNPSSWAQKAIDNGTSQLALKDPNIKLAPISAEDLPEAKKTFEAMGVNEKLNFISGLVSNAKKYGTKGHAIWGATLGQLGGGDQSYIMAGIARMNNFKSTKGEDVATAIISGTQALKNKQLIMPKDDLLKQEFNKYVGSTVSGNTANMTFASFKSLYAHITERDNYQHKDKDDISKDITNIALGLATGGVYDQDVKYGNQKKWKVSKPYGMEDKIFSNHLESGYAIISKNTGIPVSELEGLRLRRSDKRSAKGEIQYDLINERGNPLQSGGNYWRINIMGATK
ncbi:methyl-coenzyme M reductase [Acinetobacter sp. ANC 5378]|uniref:methyl-coenzyme M reductase n=1 Tax=Acinetobacter sp. ANC 5378 TaxID=2731249 RepID=UPI00149051C9|nr:methyl-coenzyme M reductase [Acinetobacter sp. ANC 5378]NNG82041.1 methyl-coenzyme M reductase [Acinetobacter sp. ANC 5378]